MSDSLLDRAKLAIEEGRRLREQKRIIADSRDEHLGDLRRSKLENAMVRSEIRAHRDDRGGGTNLTWRPRAPGAENAFKASSESDPEEQA